MRPLSILFLGTQIATGGAQKVLLDQARWFIDRGHTVTAAFIYDKEGLHKKWQEANAFPIICLCAFRAGAGALEKSLSVIRGLWSLWKLVYRERYDVIETFTLDSNVLGLPLAWWAGIPVRIATYHGFIEDLPCWRQRLHALLINSKIASALVAVSEMTRQNALDEGIRPERIVVIQNGIVPVSIEGVDKQAVKREMGMGEDDLLLLSVGRLVYQKGHEFLVAAMPSVLEEFPNVRLVICGEGFLRPQLKMQINTLGVGKSVKLLGNFDNVARFLAAADMFVLPSRWEGLPIALLEAMSVGLPVVGTRVEGVSEVVVENEHGLLTPVGDTSALSRAILHLLRDPQARCRLGAAAKYRLLEHYSIGRMGERYLSLIYEIQRNGQQV